MRAIFGIISLLVVLGIVGVVVKRQLASQASVIAPVPASPNGAPNPGPNASVKDQAANAQQQYKQAIEAAMQARPDPDTGKTESPDAK